MSAPAVLEAAGKRAAGQPAAAKAVLLRFLAARPRDVGALCLLAEVHLELGEGAAALVAVDRAVAAERAAGGSGDAGALRVRVLVAMSKWEEALAAGASLCAGVGAGGGAGAPEAWRVWADTLVKCGRPGEAVRALRAGLAACGDREDLLLSLVYAENVAGVAEPREERELHERLARSATGDGGVGARGRRFANRPDPDRVVRVAILSSDLRLHSCAFFLEGWLPHLSPERVELYLYSTAGATDAVTERLRRLGRWRECGRLSPEGMRDLAAEDGIDVLVDANAWTAPGHLRALALGLAPVQVTYLGYPGTTGLANVDWRLVDAVSDPPGSEGACSERLWRMGGCLWNFCPDPGWPRVVERASGAGVTFGSFNHSAKVGERCVELWGAVLRAVPGSELLVKGPPGSEPAMPWLRRFEAAAGPGRVRVLPHVPDTAGHLAMYGEVDIALDPVPYEGTTTTCEALWMGVPVVSLRGDRHRTRVGASLLGAVGLPELIAEHEDGYVRIAAELARDGARRAEWRRTLRERMAGSGVCDGAGYAARFEGAVRGMWTAWCDGRGTP